LPCRERSNSVTGLSAALGTFAGDVAHNVATAKIDLCGG
jgi:hypothetical protein